MQSWPYLAIVGLNAGMTQNYLSTWHAKLCLQYISCPWCMLAVCARPFCNAWANALAADVQRCYAQEGQRIIGDSHPHVVLLFSDIVGFSSLAQSLPPVEVFVLVRLPGQRCTRWIPWTACSGRLSWRETVCSI